MDLTSRPVYGLRQVDKILGLSSGTSRRWIDGYSRSGKSYPPVVREHPTGDEIVTWGEFVETRLLAEYRDAGVPLLHMRPAIDQLRALFDTPYPLASSRAWLDVNGRELILQVQDDVKLDRKLSLVVRSGQGLLDWAEPARDFQRSAEWENECVRRIRPEADIEQVVLDPLISLGEPSVRGVRTEIIAELVRAGETPEDIADMYELPRSTVDAAVRYELLRSHVS